MPQSPRPVLLGPLGAALHSLTSPKTIFRAHGYSHALARPRARSSSASTLHPKTAFLNEFHEKLTAQLRNLAPLLRHGVNLDWSATALDVCISAHVHVHELFPHMCSALEEDKLRRVDEHLDGTLAVLELCESIKCALSRTKERALALRLLAISLARRSHDVAQMARARSCLGAAPKKAEWTARGSNLRFRTASSKLREVAQRLGIGNWRKQEDENEFLEMIKACMCATIFLCGAIVASLGSKRRCSLPLPPSGRSKWTVALQQLHQVLKHQLHAASSAAAATCARVAELRALEGSASRLGDALERATTCMCGARGSEELAEAVKRLNESVCVVEERMPALEKKIERLFKVLVQSRMALLDTLSYS